MERTYGKVVECACVIVSLRLSWESGGCEEDGDEAEMVNV